MTTPTIANEPSRRMAIPRPVWWREVVYVICFYGVYSYVRNTFGSSSRLGVSAGRAVANATRVVDVERSLGLFFEERLQRWFLDWAWFLRFWNIFYGSFHFVVTIAVLVVLFVTRPNRYRLYRNILAATTAIALVGFALFPLMPPRLLGGPPPYGADLSSYEFVDTLEAVGGLWSFGSGAVSKISNQWAAMPSLHMAWALWCTSAIVPVARRRVTKVLLLAYPAVTLFAIVVTANHYWLDAVAGALTLGAGWWIAVGLTTWWEQLQVARATEPLASVEVQGRRDVPGAATLRRDQKSV